MRVCGKPRATPSYGWDKVQATGSGAGRGDLLRAIPVKTIETCSHPTSSSPQNLLWPGTAPFRQSWRCCGGAGARAAASASAAVGAGARVGEGEGASAGVGAGVDVDAGTGGVAGAEA